jgi:hypothetical protein
MQTDAFVLGGSAWPRREATTGWSDLGRDEVRETL